MKDEVVNNLISNKSGVYLDCTLGFGGHAQEISNNLDESGMVIGLDCDQDAFAYSKDKFKSNKKVKVFNSNYLDFENILNSLKITEIDGAIMDLGISSFQIDHKSKGFSYRIDSDLDMRFDSSYKKTAFKVLNSYSENRISDIIKNFGEERNYKKISNSIVRFSKKNNMNTTFDLKEAITKAISYKTNMNKIFSRVFQSIRIEVNQEFQNINKMIESLPKRIKAGGKILWITFHSLEDRVVKKSTFKLDGTEIITTNGKKKIKLISKKVIRPSRQEILNNKRSRSAKLRGLTILEC